MSKPLSAKFTLNDLRAARTSGVKVPMLTCYDYSTARLMHEVGVPAILVGDSAANVMLGYESTVFAPLGFMIEITAAVRRGSPNCLLMADMPFGSYQVSTAQGMRNLIRMARQSGCDCIKIEAADSHLSLIRRATDAGVAIVTHLGLRPQSVNIYGGYKYQGRTAAQASELLALALRMQDAGAAAILLEAVPPEVSKAIVERTTVPVIGCGGGPDCHSYVFVTHDAIGLSPRTPKFVPDLGDLGGPLKQAFGRYLDLIAGGQYPTPQQCYKMPLEEAEAFRQSIKQKI